MKGLVAALLMALNGLTLATLDLSALCHNQDQGELLPHPLDCSAYIVCGIKTSLQYCEMGLHFDAKQKVCNWPQNANCQLELNITDTPLQTLMAIDVKTGQIVDPMQDYDAGNVICRHYGVYFLPHPLICQAYYLCAYGHMYQLGCGLDTLWNFKKEQCEINYKAECFAKTADENKEVEALASACSLAAATTTDGQTTNTFHPTGSYHTATATGSTAEMDPSYQTTNTFHPTGSIYTATATATTADMGSSYQTMDTFNPTGSIYAATATATIADMGSSTTSTPTSEPSSISTALPTKTTDTFHPTGSYHSATATATTDQMASSKVSKTTIKASKPSKAPNSSNPFSLVCPDNQQSYIAHPEDCSKYFMCIRGMLVMTSCPPGLYWDAKKTLCDLPKYVKCFQ